MESAQTVQALPAKMEAVYLPASEVGGYFYQVLDRAGGSRVVLVSATIGMLRRENSSSPGAILAGLNDALAGHTGGGRFTFVSDGFDRTREIATKSAHEIAKAAKAWGQNDDITVVTVRRAEC